MKDHVDRIEDAIRKSGVFSMDPARRRAIAVQLGANNYNAGQVTMVWHEAIRSSGDTNQARGLLASVLCDLTRFRDVVRDLEDAERRRHQLQGDSSSIAHVTEQNPFGWSRPEQMRHLDHSVQGDWNSFRKSQNLTTSEAADAGTTDVRRHGCSRYEVLGPGDWEKVRRIRNGTGKAGETVQDATPYWDAGVVEMAQGRALQAPPDAPERAVYGEEAP